MGGIEDSVSLSTTTLAPSAPHGAQAKTPCDSAGRTRPVFSEPVKDGVLPVGHDA